MLPITEVLNTIRGRLSQVGVDALADYELLSFFLAWGMSSRKQESLFDLAWKILEQTGGLTGLARCDVDELMQLPGLGRAKAFLLKVAIELGRRIAVPALPEGKSISSSADVAEWFRCQLQDQTRECLFALLLDSKNRPIKNMRVTEGSWTCCPVDPKVILSACLKMAAPAFILVHNHPSGDPTPSRDDLELTERMVRAGQLVGIRLLDHVVVGRGGYYSLKDTGLI